MKCKHERAPLYATFCPDCGQRIVAQRGEIKVPVPKQKGNTWFAQVTVDGKRAYISGNSEEEYYAKARATKQGLIETKKAASKVTLKAAIEKYIKDNDRVLSPSTIRGYNTYKNNRFANYIDRPIDRIDYQRMVNDELLSVKPKTVLNAFRLVTASLHAIGYDPPDVNLPKAPRAERPWLDYEQIVTFLAAIRDKDCELGALLALHGLRRSELLHLTAEDIDTKKWRIFVHGASVVGSTQKLVDKDTNKNITSTRTVNIVIPRLNDVINGKTGKLITGNPNSLWRQINRVCRENNLPEVGVHGLRHSYISLCFHLGWDIQTVMYQGGYSNMQTVNDVYRHLAAQDANEDINRMKDFFSKNEAGQKPARIG